MGRRIHVTIFDLVGQPEARWVVFYSSATAPTEACTTTRTQSSRCASASPCWLTIWTVRRCPTATGPRSAAQRVELGFKQVKWLAGIESVARFSEVGGGHGGYNPDHEFFGYRQSI